MSFRDTLIGTPSPQEEVLLNLEESNHRMVADSVVEDMNRGRSPSFLSVVRPDLLLGFAKPFLDSYKSYPNSRPTDAGKEYSFEHFELLAEEGDPAAISTLPKLSTSVGQLAIAMELALEHQGAVAAWRSERPYLQLIGSFNPQHVGHRATMQLALETAGPKSSVTSQLVDKHPVKGDSIPPYETRFVPAERRLYTSSIIDIPRVTQLDLPAGAGLAPTGVEQIDLLAHMTGDSSLRWLMGSDKFMTDAQKAQEGRQKAILRFADRRIHLYVARRATHDKQELDDTVARVRNEYGTAITVIKEPDKDNVLGVLGSAASLIRQYRQEGRHQEADRMESPDLLLPALGPR